MKYNFSNWQIDNSSSMGNIIMKKNISTPYHNTKVWPIRPNHNHRNIHVMNKETHDGNMLVLWLLELKP